LLVVRGSDESSLAAEIEEFHVRDGLAEELTTETGKFLH
jgi:hypothetical protein